MPDFEPGQRFMKTTVGKNSLSGKMIQIAIDAVGTWATYGLVARCEPQQQQDRWKRLRPNKNSAISLALNVQFH